MTSKLTGTMQQMATFMANIAHCPSPNKDELSITFDQLLKYLNPISYFLNLRYMNMTSTPCICLPY